MSGLFFHGYTTKINKIFIIRKIRNQRMKRSIEMMIVIISSGIWYMGYEVWAWHDIEWNETK